MIALPSALVVAVVCLAVPALAADKPAEQPAAAAPKDAPAKPAPAKQADFMLGEMRVQTLPAMTLIFASEKTSFDKFLNVVNKVMPQLNKGLEEGKFRSAGCCVLRYRDFKAMDQPFTFDVGWVVPDNTKPIEGLKVEKTQPFKCATLLLTGAPANLSKAYEKLVGQMTAAGHQPGNESREMYLYWEGPESPNNVIQIQMAIADNAGKL